MAAKTICFINQKGGCGKSSCCFHLGGQLAASGNRVLLIDADPQGSLSQGFFGSERVELMSFHDTLAACFVGDASAHILSILAKPTAFDRLDIICANQTLAQFNSPCPENTGLSQFALEQLVGELGNAYELILIDCPPNLYQCSWNALLAADYVVIPTQEELRHTIIGTNIQAIDRTRRTSGGCFIGAKCRFRRWIQMEVAEP